MRKVLFLLLLLGCISVMARVWHVDSNGSDTNDGTQKSPFATISKAAYLALAGDTVLIHKGVYREWVSPANGGNDSMNRIIYMAAPNEEVWLKGSDQVSGWEKGKDGIWTVRVPNSLFGDFNPFSLNLFGDWLHKGGDLHLGEVYLNGKSLKEVRTREENSKLSLTWFAEVGNTNTMIQANFGEANPNKEIIEINVRPTCFFPKTTGVNYITVKGLKISQAATQWATPTNEQIGIIGPNWSKGWIIEDCDISLSKCVGICLGKDRASGHNLWSLYRKKGMYVKHGFNREIESIFKAYNLGWSKENIGSHTIQSNRIYDCGQAGIVGHMGAAFSNIRNNEIYNIATTNEIGGFETAGIKLHAAIDVTLEQNCITNTIMGIWLGWQAQGTHVARNLIADSKQQDLFIEVSHGPTLIYNNILLSDLGLFIDAQGIVFANNLISGKTAVRASTVRYTPYHEPHSTKIKGLFNNTGGDVRFYNNIFLGNAPDSIRGKNGLCVYNDYPTPTEMSASSSKKSHYLNCRFPVWTAGNIYFYQAKPFKEEVTAAEYPDKKLDIKMYKKDGKYHLNDYLKEIGNFSSESVAVNTTMLGVTFTSEAAFENTNGATFLLKNDFSGRNRNESKPMPGPFEQSVNSVIWEMQRD